jgi:hypothetical protein
MLIFSINNKREKQLKKLSCVEYQQVQKEEHVTRYIGVGLFFLLFILTYALPENVLENLTILRIFVDFMASIFPSIAKYGYYSDFPQVAQLVYSLGIITIPVLSFILYKVFIKNPIRSKMTRQRLIINLFSAIIILIIAVVVALFLLPSVPHFHGTEISKLLHSVYYSRFWFSIFSTLCLFVIFFIFTEIIINIKMIVSIISFNYSNQKNNVMKEDN